MPILFRGAFRIFFLLAGTAAAITLPLWLAALAGHGLPGIDLFWHSHELVFGMVGAVFAGFFLTAVPKWTQTTPLPPPALAALGALWLLCRGLGLGLTGPWAAVDALFFVVLAAIIGVPIFRRRSKRNYLFPGLVLAMAAADIVGHMAPAWTLLATRAAVFAAVAVVVIFGGRITPMFTRNALGLPVRGRSWVDLAAIGCVLALVPLALLPQQTHLTAGVAALGAVLAALRLRGWQGWAARGRPLLWVLHLGQLWVPIALALWAMSALEPTRLPPSTALHAATVGVLGTNMLAMVSRVSLGHTGRPLRAHPAMTVAFVAMVMAGAVRVAVPGAMWALHASGALWTLAWVLFLMVYTPILFKPRVGGTH